MSPTKKMWSARMARVVNMKKIFGGVFGIFSIKISVAKTFFFWCIAMAATWLFPFGNLFFYVATFGPLVCAYSVIQNIWIYIHNPEPYDDHSDGWMGIFLFSAIFVFAYMLFLLIMPAPSGIIKNAAEDACYANMLIKQQTASPNEYYSIHAHLRRKHHCAYGMYNDVISELKREHVGRFESQSGTKKESN